MDSAQRVTIHESLITAVRGLTVARPSTVRRLRPIADLQFVIITGLSGAGKSNAMKVFEDLGFFCVDNLPPALLPKFAELCMQSEGRVQRAALAIAARGGEFLNDLFTSLNALEAMGLAYVILFLDAADDVLVRRFAATRRKHPLPQPGGSMVGIRAERDRLEAGKGQAGKNIETATPRV